MPSFRKDPFGHAWVLISPERGLLASDFGSIEPATGPSPLSPGGDASLREIAALRPSASTAGGPDWRVRVVEHPAAMVQDRPASFGGAAPFEHAASRGFQEIIIEHPDAAERLETMPREHVTEVLRVYRDRLALLAKKDGIRHVQVSRSVGRPAGAQYDHPHAQVLALPVSNRWLDEEAAVARGHFASTGRCLFCDVIAAELEQRERVVTQNADFVAFAPYASKQPFETWIVPRRHPGPFATEPGNLLPSLAELIQVVLRSLNAALNDPPYNLVLHTLPLVDQAFHWHIEILPRLTRQSGFDWGTGFYVNPTPPEDAARFLREALALQEVGQ
jgi:UDPglucose--hexose-1-phosphate uridylyltransferase